MAIQEDVNTLHEAEVAPEGLQTQELLLNMGPQHPGTHGILRFLLTLEGETVVDCTPVIGYLHRGIEKILENRPILGGIRYMDNVDYLSPMLNEITYVGAVEQLMGVEAPRRAQFIRLLVGELQRIASHLVAVGSLAADLSALGVSPLFYSFRDRDGILALFEALCGSRFNVNYQRVGGVLHDFPNGWLSTCESWLDGFEKNLAELVVFTLDNEFFQLRTK